MDFKEMLLLAQMGNEAAVIMLLEMYKPLLIKNAILNVYADNREIIADGVPEVEGYMEMVLPNMEENELFKNELLEIVVDVTKFLPEIA